MHRLYSSWKVFFMLLWRQNVTLCEEWRDWKNDAESPKDLLPLRDFNKKPNCLRRSFFNLHSLFHRIAKHVEESEKKHTIQKVWTSGFNLFTKFIEVMIGLFCKIPSTQTLYLTLTKSDWKPMFIISVQL